MPDRHHIFISYSHEDKKWLEKLIQFVKPLEKYGKIAPLVWDGLIQPGQKWCDEIRRGLESARVAVLLVSPSFLASEFIFREELPVILAKAERSQLVLIWCLVRPGLYQESPIWDYQAAHDPSCAWSTLGEPQLEELLVRISAKLKEVFEAVGPWSGQPAKTEFALVRERIEKKAGDFSDASMMDAVRMLDEEETVVSAARSPFASVRVMLQDVVDLQLVEQICSLFVLRGDWPAALYAYDRMVALATPAHLLYMALGYECLGFIYKKFRLSGRARECCTLSRNIYYMLGLNEKAEEVGRLSQ